MEDIEGFTTDDCAGFYRTYYAPNNATARHRRRHPREGHSRQNPKSVRRARKRGDPGRRHSPRAAADGRATRVDQEADRDRQDRHRLPRAGVRRRRPRSAHHAHRSVVLRALLALPPRAHPRARDLPPSCAAGWAPSKIRGSSRSTPPLDPAKPARKSWTSLDRELLRVVTEPVTIAELEKVKAKVELGARAESRDRERKGRADRLLSNGPRRSGGRLLSARSLPANHALGSLARRTPLPGERATHDRRGAPRVACRSTDDAVPRRKPRATSGEHRGRHSVGRSIRSARAKRG